MQPDGAGFVLNAEIPLAVARRLGGRVRLAPFPPAGKCCKERLDGCIHGVGMQQLIRIGRNEPHEVPWFEPEAFVLGRSPKGDDRFGVDLTTRTSEFIQLWSFTDVHSSHSVYLFDSPPVDVGSSHICPKKYCNYDRGLYTLQGSYSQKAMCMFVLVLFVTYASCLHHLHGQFPETQLLFHRNTGTLEDCLHNALVRLLALPVELFANMF